MKQLSHSVFLGILLIISGCASFDLLDTPPPLEISFEEGYKFAELSDTAYKDESQIQEITKKYGLTLVTSKINNDKAVNYFLAKTNDDYILAVRGTASLSDTLTDLKFKLEKNSVLGINLHSGFDQAAKIITAEIQAIIPKQATIKTTGHSLGGAMAVIVAFYLINEGYNVSQVVTFGQPRVTDYVGAEKYSKLKITRYVSQKDVVPLVPPILAGYRQGGIFWHVGNEVVLEDNGTYLSLNAAKSMQRAIEASYGNFISERDISSHKMDNYLRLIRSNL